MGIVVNAVWFLRYLKTMGRITFKRLIVGHLRKLYNPNILLGNIEFAKEVCQVPIGNWAIWMYSALAWDCWPTQFWFLIYFADAI